MKIIRVFPRKTKATPIDDLVRFSGPGMFADDAADQIHISVTFTNDLRKADVLAKEWKGRGEVLIGGPALGKSKRLTWNGSANC